MSRVDAALVDVVERVATTVEPVDLEVVSLAEAAGRHLATVVTCPADLPDCDRSAMDGYAIRGDDVADASSSTPVDLEVVGSQLAGDVRSLTVAPGQAVRTATGAAIPAGADTVARVEVVERHGSRIRVTAPVATGKDVRRRAEDAAHGDVLLEAGTPLGSAQIAGLAGVGIDTVTVRRRIRVGLVVSGTEVATGEIPDALGPAIRVLLSGPPTSVAAPVVTSDDPEELTLAIRQVVERSDVVVTTGGVSVGPADRMAAVLADLGTATSYRYDVHPGRPGAVGWLDGTPVLCLPGNPGAALLQARLLAVPVACAMAGLPAPDPEPVSVSQPVTGRAGCRDFVPAVRRGELVVPVPGRGSGNLHRLGQTQGWIELPVGVDECSAGAVVDCWWVDPWTP